MINEHINFLVIPNSLYLFRLLPHYTNKICLAKAILLLLREIVTAIINIDIGTIEIGSIAIVVIINLIRFLLR